MFSTRLNATADMLRFVLFTKSSFTVRASIQRMRPRDRRLRRMSSRIAILYLNQ